MKWGIVLLELASAGARMAAVAIDICMIFIK